MAAAAADLTTCSICLEDLVDPRSLPCLHTFCFKCLNTYCEKAKQKHQEQLLSSSVNSDIIEFVCPMCCKQIRLPDRGVEEFPHSFVHEELVQKKYVSVTKRGNSADLCEVCQVDSDDHVPNAEVFCRDCQQKLCDRCAKPHRQMRGKAHHIVQLSEAAEVQLVQMRSIFCERDPEEQVKMYCVDCHKNICVVCYATEHNGHLCRKIDDAAAEVKRNIADALKTVKTSTDSFLLLKKQTETERDRLINEVSSAEQQIISLGTDIKQLVDDRINGLLNELTMAKDTIVKELTTRFDEFELALTALGSYETYATHLINNGRSWDITRNDKPLRERASELSRMYRPDQSGVDIRVPRVVLTPMVLDEFRRRVNDMENFVARVDFFDYSLEPRQLCELPDSDPVWGVASIDERVYVLRSRVTDQIETYEYVQSDDGSVGSGDTTSTSVAPNIGITNTPMKRIREVSRMSIPGLRGLADMASCPLNRCLFVVDCVARCIHRISVPDGTQSRSNAVFSAWPVNDDPWGVSVSSTSGHVLVTCDEVQTLKEFTDNGRLLRVIKLKSDILNPCHAIRLMDTAVVGDDLSAAAAAGDGAKSSGQYLVCHGAGSDIVHRVCLVGADGGTRLAYGSSTTSIQTQTMGVPDIVVNCSSDGKPTTQRKLLDGPRHLAVDSKGFVFVADFNNGRVVLLNPRLKPVGDVVLSRAAFTARNSIHNGSNATDPTLTSKHCFKPGKLQWNPWRLHLDEERSRLYVVENEWNDSRWTSGRVVVFEL